MLMKQFQLFRNFNWAKHPLVKGKSKFYFTLLGFVDIVLVVLAFVLSYAFTQPGGLSLLQSFDYTILLFMMIPVWAIVLHITNAAKIPRISKNMNLLFELVQFSILSALMMFLFIFAFKLDLVSRSFVISFLCSHFVALFIFRLATYKFFKYYRSNGHNTRNVIVIADATSETIINQIIENKEWGFRLMMIVSNSKLLKAIYADKVKIIPDVGTLNLRNIMTFDIVDEIIYCKRNVNQQEIESLVKSCQEIGVVFRLQSDLSPLTYEKAQTRLLDMPFITYSNVPGDYFGVAWKSLSDIIFSLIILVMLSPFMLIIAFIIKFTSKGPVFFKQVRVGLRGRQFYLYKFRTMVVNAEELKVRLMEQNEMDGPVFKIKNDPRITPVGRFLRKTGLDELPQFFNVLKGEMSLIGPRPPLPDEVKKYERWQLRRLSVKPGITCTWQIEPNRNSVLFEQWMKLDLAYIDNWSPKLDIELFFKTVKTVIKGSGS